MTGLDKIITEIQDEAAGEAKRITEEAKAKADKLLADAKAESDAAVAKIDAGAQQEVADIEAARDSQVQLQRRQRTLETKQQVLAETLDKAEQSLLALDDAQYFALLVKLAAKAAEPQKGEMLLSEKDLKRLPAGFEKELNGALGKGAELAISQNTRPLAGGFVLKYGDIEQNCSFAALFDARREEFSDLVRGLLFG